jgi:hypothetical protein
MADGHATSSSDKDKEWNIPQTIQVPRVTLTTASPPDRSLDSRNRTFPVTGSKESLIRVPLGDDLESKLVHSYISDHILTRAQTSFIETLTHNVSSLTNLQFSLVGSHAAGYASRQNSLTVVTLATASSVPKTELFNTLRVSGPSRGWTVSNSPFYLHVLQLSVTGWEQMTIRLLLDQNTAQGSIRRALFQKAYMQIIEPRMAVALCAIRDVVHRHLRECVLVQYVDDILFHILWRALVEQRVIPNVLIDASPKQDARSVFDKSIWRETGAESIQELRTAWKFKGIGVVSNCTVTGMIRLFREKCLDSEDLDWCNTCPLTGDTLLDDGNTVPYGACTFLRQFHSLVVRSKDFQDLLR